MSDQPEPTQDQPIDQPVQTYEDLQKRVEELETALKTERADAINLRNRADKEKAELADYVKADIIKKLLPVVDSVNLAFAQVPEHLKDDKWAKGLVGVRKTFGKTLKDMGLESIKAEGEDFNPETMHAVQMEGDGDHMVVNKELQTGYKLAAGQVLRPAMVEVVSE